MKQAVYVLLIVQFASCGAGINETQEKFQSGDSLQVQNPHEIPPKWTADCMCFIDEAGSKAQGKYTLYHENGELKSITTYADGQYTELKLFYKNGQLERHESGDTLMIVYYEDGKRWDVGRYLNGEHHGIDTIWYPNGRVRRIKEWKMGELVWSKSFDENGKLTSSKEY